MIPRNSLFVDTAGWAAYFHQFDPIHQEVDAIVKMSIAQKRTFVTTNYIISELVPLLSVRTRIPRPQVLSVLDSLLTLPFIHIQYADAALDKAAIALLKQYSDKAWSLVDAASFVVMRQYSLTDALTTDQHFTQAGFTRLPTIP